MALDERNYEPGLMAGASTATKNSVVSGSAATVTITPNQTGATFLFDRAAGIVYTLPVPVVGLQYTFIVTTTITSNNATVVTDSASTFLGGGLVNVKTDLTTLFVIANGTSHIKVQQNGTTTGGIIGSYLIFNAVSTTLWNVQGTIYGSGTIATPMA